jgi:hypothetical protein
MLSVNGSTVILVALSKSSLGTVVVVVAQSVWHARHDEGFPWGVSINGQAFVALGVWHPKQLEVGIGSAPAAPG